MELGSHPSGPTDHLKLGTRPLTCLKNCNSLSASVSRCRHWAKALENSVSWACRARKRAPWGPSSAASQPASGCRNFSPRLNCSWRQRLGSEAGLGYLVPEPRSPPLTSTHHHQVFPAIKDLPFTPDPFPSLSPSPQPYFLEELFILTITTSSPCQPTSQHFSGLV